MRQHEQTKNHEFVERHAPFSRFSACQYIPLASLQCIHSHMSQRDNCFKRNDRPYAYINFDDKLQIPKAAE